MTRWLMLGIAIAAEVTATIALRASVDQAAWLPLVAVGYPVALVSLGLTLRTGLPIGVAYGIWGASGVALTALLGATLFDERLGLGAIVGIGLIVGGVLLVETGSHEAP